MNELDILRRIIDGRIRPGQRNAATIAERQVEKGSAGAGRPRMINCYNHSAAEDRKYGLYGRARYGSVRYSRE